MANGFTSVFFLSMYHVSSAMIRSLCFDTKQPAKLGNFLMPVEMFYKNNQIWNQPVTHILKPHLVLLKFA